MTDGFGVAANAGIDHRIEFKSNLYAGTWAGEVNGGEVWRGGNGLNWTRVISQRFSDPTNGGGVWAYLDKQVYLPVVLKNR